MAVKRKKLAKSTTGAANFRANLRALARLMDEDNVPDDDRYFLVEPHARKAFVEAVRIILTTSRNRIITQNKR